MEDAATAEISRAQLWQWIRHGCTHERGRGHHAPSSTRASATPCSRASPARAAPHLDDAARILDGLVLDSGFAPFLTLRAGELLP